MTSNRKLHKRQAKQTIAKQVRSVIDGMAETKVNSLNAVAQTVSSAGGVYDIGINIPEGNDVSMRSGTTIMLEQLRLYYRCFAVTTSQTFRFILFQDRFNNGVTPTVTELLPTTTYLSQFSDIRELQQHRYIILDDWYANSQISGEIIKSHNRTIKLHRKIFYNGATSVVASGGHNALFLCVIGSSSTGTFDFRIQMMYKDF